MEGNQEDVQQYTDDKPVHISAIRDLDLIKNDPIKNKPNDHKDEMVITISIADLNASEPMLKPDTNRFTLFPIKRHDLWKAYKNHEKAIWNAEELDYSADKIEWEQLSNDEKYFIEHILAFFNGFLQAGQFFTSSTTGALVASAITL